MDDKVSEDKHISRWLGQQNLIMSDEIESKTVHNEKEVNQLRKTLSEVKLIENISQHLKQSVYPGQFIVVTLIQAVKPLSMTVTSLLF